jgi:hypothetical protein
LRDDGDEWSLTLKEKGGKHRVIPVRSDLKSSLTTYITVAGLWDAPEPSPLFRATVRREISAAERSDLSRRKNSGCFSAAKSSSARQQIDLNA